MRPWSNWKAGKYTAEDTVSKKEQYYYRDERRRFVMENVVSIESEASTGTAMESSVISANVSSGCREKLTHPGQTVAVVMPEPVSCGQSHLLPSSVFKWA